MYTPWETLEKFRFTLPHFPLRTLQQQQNCIDSLKNCQLQRASISKFCLTYT